jgi:hypothetical protein
MEDEMDEQALAAIEAKRTGLMERTFWTEIGDDRCGDLIEGDIPALVAEVRRLQAALRISQDDHAREGRKLSADRDRWRERCEKAETEWWGSDRVPRADDAATVARVQDMLDRAGRLRQP